MKILAIHADHLDFEAKKQAIKDPEPTDNPKASVKECLVVFMSVEKPDEADQAAVVQELVDQVRDIAEKVNTKRIVLYPYAHLSSDLADLKVAKQVLLDAHEAVQKAGFEVSHAPFGWYKSFEISCKGHPLSELSRQFSGKKQAKVQLDKPFELSGEDLDNDQKVMLSASFALVKALVEMFPKAEPGVIGFYHDRAFVDLANVRVKGEQLKSIESCVKKLLKQSSKIEDAKVEGRFQEGIAEDLGDHAKAYSSDGVTLVPPFKEPFLPSTGNIKSFRLLEAASAYWKNNAANEQLTRLYFVAFDTPEKLKGYEERLSQAQARDHRVLGEQLELFSMHPEAPGMPFFHDKGTFIYRQLERFMVERMTELGYEFLKTPLIMNKSLWLRSGHWDHYKENMYFTQIDGADYAVKPMNCPGHILVYRNRPHSYRELPIKAGEFGLVHRHELSGVLSGLFRVRCFTQDDAHVFCTQEQLKEQIVELIELVQRVYSAFGFEYHLELSTRPAKAMGDPKLWKVAEETLETAMKAKELNYKVNPGDGAFYGPKIDCHVKDALGRSWQCGTIQLDFQMPEKFDLTYEGADGHKHRPVMLHRAIYGSFERFFGILLEHFAGRYPLWLSPVPVRLVTVTDRSVPFAEEVLASLKAAGFDRASIDDRTETLGKKIREAQLEQVNYIVTIGDKESEQRTLSVRSRAGEVRHDVALDEFIEGLRGERDERRL